MPLLPTQKTKPDTNLMNYIWFIYGEPKIGKSTFCSQMPEALFLKTEEGLKGLEAYQVGITKWEDVYEVGAELEAGNHQFKTVVIDTIDNFYKLCEDYICRTYHIAHPDELKMGKGYSFVKKECMKVLTTFSMLPYGLALVSHSVTKEVKDPSGLKIMRTVSSLSDSARMLITSFVDQILYFYKATSVDENGQEKYDRYILTQGVPQIEAGGRFQHLPPVIPMNFYSLQQIWENGIRNNPQWLSNPTKAA